MSSLRGYDKIAPKLVAEPKEVYSSSSVETTENPVVSTKRALSKDSVVEKVAEEQQQERKLNMDTVARMFATPIAQWTLSQWALLFVLIWLTGYFLRRCPCIYDLLACYCCYEIFCDPNPGFLAF